MKRLLAAFAMLVLCYLGACFVAWEFPNPYADMEPRIRTLWLIISAALAGSAYILVQPRNG